MICLQHIVDQLS